MSSFYEYHPTNFHTNPKSDDNFTEPFCYLRVARALGIWASVSIGLFLIFLFVLHDTAKRLNGLTYYRIEAIEPALTNHINPHSGKEQHEGYTFGIHSYIHRKTKEQQVWWLLLRRTFWADVLMLPSIGWLLLSIT